MKDQYKSHDNLSIDENKFIITGGLIDRKYIAHTFRLFSNKFYKCYEVEKTNNNLKGGQISVKFTVGENGKVIEAEIESNKTNKNIEDCIIYIIKNLKFPPPIGNLSTIRYTFDFK